MRQNLLPLKVNEILPRSSDKLTVEIWSDVICPWCWIGVTRLSKALRAFGRPDQVTVVHHAFRLMPGAPPRAVEEVVSAKRDQNKSCSKSYAKGERSMNIMPPVGLVLAA